MEKKECGDHLNIKMSSFEYMDSHYKDKGVLWLSYLYNGNPHTWKYGLYVDTWLCCHLFWYIATHLTVEWSKWNQLMRNFNKETSLEFLIQWICLCLLLYQSDYNEILHISRQLCSVILKLTHCGLVKPHGDIKKVKFGSGNDLLPDYTKPVSEPIFNFDLSSKMYCGFHLKAIPQEVLMKLYCEMFREITLLKLLPHLPGVSELISVIWYLIRWGFHIHV